MPVSSVRRTKTGGGEGRRGEAADADADHMPGSGRVAFHLGAQGAHGGGGAAHVLAFQQTDDARFADGQGGEHQRAVGDGFVARHRDAAAKRPFGAMGS